MICSTLIWPSVYALIRSPSILERNEGIIPSDLEGIIPFFFKGTIFKMPITGTP
jgi:hypothetical protein